MRVHEAAEQHQKTPVSGFSLIELMIVLVVLLVITGAIFQVIKLSTERSVTEQTKVDMFQEAREFMDQMSRDLRQAGYPSPRNMDPSVLTQNPIMNDHHAAAGLVKVDTGDLWFEGDVDGSGTVSVVQYHLDTARRTNCPCLKRSQLPKIDASPLSQSTPTYQVEVQGVQNTNIFSAFNNGVAVACPVTVATSTGDGYCSSRYGAGHADAASRDDRSANAPETSHDAGYNRQTE